MSALKRRESSFLEPLAGTRWRSLPVNEDGHIFCAMKRGAAIVVFGLMSACPAFASMRCGTKIIDEGDTRSEVAAKCGEPVEVVNQRSVYRRPVIWTDGRPYYVGESAMEVQVEAWIYNFGPNKLMRRIRFEGGIVVEIETLGYGYIK
jgi:Protein of unknown function (DUF2845)